MFLRGIKLGNAYFTPNAITHFKGTNDKIIILIFNINKLKMVFILSNWVEAENKNTFCDHFKVADNHKFAYI